MRIFGGVYGGAVHRGDHPVEVINPADGNVLATVDGVSAAQAEAAISSARAAFPAWAALPEEDRQRLMLRCADIIEQHAEELATLLTQEQGKPLNGLGSRFELSMAATWTRNAANLSLPVDIIQSDDQAHVAVHRMPLGVVAAIVPWNWPLLIAIWQVMPAIRAGNTVVLKPSPFTPLSTLRLVELLQDALPAGVLNAVVGDEAVGPTMTAHPDVAKVSFTGSSATGRRIMASAASTLKRLTLELGGNDAGIVLPDCDPDEIAEALFWSAFINNGQTCVALKRLYVHEDIYDRVCDALLAYARTVKVGDGRDESSQLGPIQNRLQYEKVSRLVERARADGARILCGGEPSEEDGYFYPVTLIADVTDGTPIVDEEQFGPALPIIRYSDVNDAIRRANATEVGLGGSIWSKDIAKARSLATRLECGTAWVNKHGPIRPDTPFGGIKASGFGVQFGPLGLDEFVSLHVVHD
ncbi:aldehyde dehydrogenase family protein [Novosphingobium sp.]|uniref:aldehyde dehydrogenase family protein n=1 Tax=Novosphingobium sp. TaxID=1874826 RepID=UPI002B47B066|nr:aldehyde dehydrogenase family protein [Novosphingobium sp.]HKR93163.1 aldehyde dehydrogenase family protein [Novosphingobium sp.]